MRRAQLNLRELSTRVDLRYNDLEQYNTQLTTQELMLRDLAVKSKHLTMEKNQLLNEYAKAVAEKNNYLRELHINGKLPYIEHLEKLKAEIQRQVDDVTLLDYQKDSILHTEKKWIDLIQILLEVFSVNEEEEQKDFEDRLKENFLIEKEQRENQSARHRKRGNTPKHRSKAMSISTKGFKGHRRQNSMGSKRRLSSSRKKIGSRPGSTRSKKKRRNNSDSEESDVDRGAGVSSRRGSGTL